MPPSADFVAHVLDLMSDWGGVSARRLFGGYGLYRQGVMFGLVAYDALYFRVDARNRPEFEAAGMRPFVYDGKGTSIEMPYWEAPSELFDDSESMTRWAQCALDAAVGAQAKRRDMAKPRQRSSRRRRRNITKI
jgi:DNA transformation protein